MPDDLARLEAVREGLIATQRALERDRKAVTAFTFFEVVCAAIVVLPISFFLIRAVVIGQLSLAFLVCGFVALAICFSIGAWLDKSPHLGWGYPPDSKVGLICAVVLGALFGAPILEPRDERPKVVRELLAEIERRIAVLKSSGAHNDVRP